MSELTLRELAAACAPRIAAKVEAAVVSTVRAELANVIEQVLAESYPGETFRHYAATRPASMRRDRDQAIRAKYTGQNAAALAKEFGISTRMIFKIVSGRK